MSSSFLIITLTLLVGLVARASADVIMWTDAMDIGVGGRSFPSNDANLTYARFPLGAEADLNSGEWSYGLDSAGLFVQFYSNATSIHVNYTLRNPFAPYATPFPNLSPLAASGCDLYAYDYNATTAALAWRWVASSFNQLNAPNGVVVESPLFSNASGWPVGPVPKNPTWDGVSLYRLHFPNYNGVRSLAVGVISGASLIPDLSWNISAPIVWLGTSITQGGVTSRPGQAYVSRLSLTLPRPVFNYGLCGSCRLEPGLSKWMTAMPRVPSILVISCTENMDVEQVTTNTVPFVLAIRAAWGKSLPIVLVEPIRDSPSWLQGNSTYQRPQLRAALYAAYQSLVSGGDTALTYVFGDSLLVGADDDMEEFTYEGVHPLDRGHALIAEAMQSVLVPLLATAPAERDHLVSINDIMQAKITKTTSPNDFVPINLPFTSATTTQAPPPTLEWTDASLLTVRGRAFPVDTLPSPYSRLPTAAHGKVTDSVWSLSLNSAGVFISFESDASEIWVNYTLASPTEEMPHFASSGTSGADLWCYDVTNQRYRFVAPSQFPFNTRNIIQEFTRPNVNVTTPGVPLKWLLFLATYNTVSAVQIGTPLNSIINPSEPFPVANVKPIIWYGTSILQGGVSIKVGNVETARVSMALNREVFNFGFSGNCHFDLNVGSFLTQISDPAAIIIDCMWNSGGPTINTTAYALIKYLRSNGIAATTPIILAEGLPFGRNWAVPDDATSQAVDNAYLRQAYNLLIDEGDTALFYVDESQLFGAEALRDSATAAGLHATDAGMHDMAAAFIKLLPTLIKT